MSRAPAPPSPPIDPAEGFPRLEGETEQAFIKRFAEHLALLRRASDVGLDGKPPKVGEA